jgi:hypothetical protein
MKRPVTPPARVTVPRPNTDRANLKGGHGLLRAKARPDGGEKTSGALVSGPPSRVAARNQVPYADLWRTVQIPSTRDIRRLAPPSLPRNERFETMADVHARKDKLIQILEGHEPDIADALHSCAPVSRCLLPGCPECSRRYRGYLFSETTRVNALPLAGPREFVTVYLDTVPAGSLSRVSIKDEHLKFRKRLERLGFQGSLLIGGTEVAWKAAERVWILHLHVLAIGVDPAAWERLRDNMGNTGRSIPLRREPLRNAVRPLSYLQKFVTLHRPGRSFGGKPATAYPLKAPQVAELCSWWANHRLEDFMFLFGARRRGARIEPEVGRQAVGPVGLVGRPRVIFSKTLSVVFVRRDVTVRVDYREEISIQDED